MARLQRANLDLADVRRRTAAARPSGSGRSRSDGRTSKPGLRWSSSTATAARIGDAAWRQALGNHNRVVRLKGIDEPMEVFALVG
jgi:hypothetical protein